MGVGLALSSHGLAAAQAPFCDSLVCSVCYVICCIGGACYCCTNPYAVDCSDPSCCIVPNWPNCSGGLDCPLRYPTDCIGNSPKHVLRIG